MLVVAAAIILDHDKVLIAQREEGTNMEFKWEFPGGKLEGDETPEQCLIREIKEELDMVIEPIEIEDLDLMVLESIRQNPAGINPDIIEKLDKVIEEKQLEEKERQESQNEKNETTDKN